MQFFLSKSSSKSYPYQFDFNPRAVNVGVVHLHKAVGVVVISCEAGFPDAAFGHGLHLHARKRAHGRDDFAICVFHVGLVNLVVLGIAARIRCVVPHLKPYDATSLILLFWACTMKLAYPISTIKVVMILFMVNDL